MAKNAKTTPRRSLVEPATSGTVPPDPNSAATDSAIAADELVVVDVPKAFTLTLDDHSERPIRPGVQKMPRLLAEHWYSVAMGVKPYDIDAVGE